MSESDHQENCDVPHRLLLLRHAKAQWPQPGLRDFDRQLTREGVRDAATTGAMMVAAGYRPDAVLCSSARRCRETWLAMAELFDVVGLEYADGLYDTDAAGYLEIIRARQGASSLLVVGHNPMTEELAMALTAGSGTSTEALAGGFPTCGLAVIEAPASFAELAPGTGRLAAFMTPRAGGG